jgi:c-di-GMP-related signal transduction protein
MPEIFISISVKLIFSDNIVKTIRKCSNKFFMILHVSVCLKSNVINRIEQTNTQYIENARNGLNYTKASTCFDR